ncbi:MAG TPA: hypothetical protein DD400_00085 [Rhodospirillaceae bacterium]|nr:hypothetical protein [Rhodospirillaceae bacterium]
MSDADNEKLSELSAQISKAQERSDSSSGERGDGSSSRVKAMARVLRVGTDFTATILGALGLGWFVDEQIGTAPWSMLLFLFAGVVIAFWNLIQAAGKTRDTQDRDAPEA